MKQRYFIIQVLLVILWGGFVSCSESDTYVDSLKSVSFGVSSSDITLMSGKESGEFYVWTNCDWYARSEDSWIHIKDTHSEKVEFTVDYNYGTTTRYGNVKVYINKPIYSSCSIDITQEPTSLAKMTTTYYKIDGDSHPLTVTAVSSQSWTIRRDYSDSWVHLGSSYSTSSTYSGSGTESVWIYVDENTGDDRRAELTVTCGSTTKTITIRQEKNPFDALMTKTNYEFGGGSQTLNVTAAASQSWTIQRNNSDSWIHLSYSSNTSSTYYGSGTKSVSIYVDKNTGGSRSATLTVTCGSKTKTITITQEKNPFDASMTTTNYKSDGGSLPLNVTAGSSQSWAIQRNYSDSWVHLSYRSNTSSTYSGRGTESVSIYVDKNTGDSRSATLTVTCGSMTKTITITQEETSFNASMGTTDYKADGGSQTLNVTASSSQSWTIKRNNSDSWVHLNSSNSTSSTYSGSGTKSVPIYVDKNTGSSRSATLTVTCGSMTKTITITQEGTPFDASMPTTNYKADGDYWRLYVTTATSQNWTIRRNYSDSWVHLGSSYSTSSTYSGSGTESVWIYVDKNTGSSRSATLTVTCSSMTKTITITQDAPFNASMPITNYKADGDYWRLYVTTATSQNWTIRRNYSDSWVHLGSSYSTSSTYSGSGTESVWIYVDKNTGSSRSATLTITCGSMTKTIIITQNAAF